MSTAVKVRDPKTFVPSAVWERQVALIMRGNEFSNEKAERIFGQTVAYFVTAGENPDLLVGPSPEVDKGVHSFMLDTIPYHRFTYGHFGRYVHHVPELETDLCVQCTNDGGGDKVEAEGRPMVLEQTVKAIEAAGFAVDRELWNMGAECTQCHAGCTDSPNTGKGK
ncbi:glycine-rich domain-containing protein [Streptomyces sp. NPDC001661]